MKCCVLLLILLLISPAFSQPATAPADIDPALWQRMTAIDVKVAGIHDLVADFQQSKFTALLKKPLVSKGTIRAMPTSMLWETASPEPTSMLLDESSASIYYPKEKLEEIYPITGQLGALAASPLPRLDVLIKYFRFSPDKVKELDPSSDETKSLAIRLTPIDDALRQHVQEVRVLIDAEHGFMLRVEYTDSDGDRTVIAFSNVRVNKHADESELKINVPSDTKITRPLEDLSPPQK